MKINITQEDLENPQRFICEGPGAPEFEVISASKKETLPRDDRRHFWGTDSL